MNSKYIKILIGICVFSVLGLLLVHNLTSINQDIGRHIKIGEIIWQTKSIPKTNLISFTATDFPFINHHWLSELVFLGLFNLVGLKGLIVLKVILGIVSFLLIFLTAQKILYNQKDKLSFLRFLILCLSFLFFVFIFIERTEVRPEIFSFLIFAIYLSVLLLVKYQNRYKLLWILPIIQLFWVNLHIYFFIGPLLFVFLFADHLITNRRNEDFKKRTKFLLLIGALIAVATLINPNGFSGAFYPLSVFKQYGYDVAENKSPFFVEKFGGSQAIDVFKVSIVFVLLSFVLIIKRFKKKIFEFLTAGFLLFAAVKMLRNFSIYSLGLFPLVGMNLSLFVDSMFGKREVGKKFKVGLILLITGLICLSLIFDYQIVSNKFYLSTNSQKTFGLSVSSGAQGGVDFVKDNNIGGQMFNNFDVGSYLVWKLYPEQKVFVDGRPEAYPVSFFSEIYKPMQESIEKWGYYSKLYNINYVFFDHRDSTPWAKQFFQNIILNKDWPMVYLDDYSVIFLKSSLENQELIKRFKIDEANAIESVKAEAGFKNAIDTKFIAKFFLDIRWNKPAIYWYNKVLDIIPEDSYSFLSLGYAYNGTQEKQYAQKAVESFEKAISLGADDSMVYTALSIAYLNVGKPVDSQIALEKALKIDPENEQAIEIFKRFFYSN